MSMNGSPGFSGRTLGIALAALAAVFASSAGVLLRHIESADAWTVLFYRSLGFTLTLLVFVVVRLRGATPARFRGIDSTDLWVAVGQGAAFLAFVQPMMQTPIATVVAVLSLAPMAVGLLGWFALGERPSALAWLAMLTAFAGVSIVVWDGFAAGGGHGVVLALLACFGYAGAVVGLRAGRRRDMTPAVCLSGVVACAVSFFMADGLAITHKDLTISILLGTLQIGAQFILLTIATRFSTAADIALVMILEVILAPLWGWVFVGEAVPLMVLYGGGVIVAALVMNAVAPAIGAGKPETRQTRFSSQRYCSIGDRP
jgi:drug/metabolite transporter (DMT)-like permease